MASATPLNIVLVEDSAVLREILSGSLATVSGCQVVAWAAEEAEAEAALRAHTPDMAIIDLELRTGSGMNLLKAVQTDPQAFGDPCMVVFSNYAHPGIQNRCRKLGADAFFDKAFQLDELLDYVRSRAEWQAAGQ